MNLIGYLWKMEKNDVILNIYNIFIVTYSIYVSRTTWPSAGHLWKIKKNDVISSIYNIFTFDVE